MATETFDVAARWAARHAEIDRRLSDPVEVARRADLAQKQAERRAFFEKFPEYVEARRLKQKALEASRIKGHWSGLLSMIRGERIDLPDYYQDPAEIARRIKRYGYDEAAHKEATRLCKIAEAEADRASTAWGLIYANLDLPWESTRA